MRAPEISEGLRLHALRQTCCLQPLCARSLLGFAEGMERLCFHVAVRARPASRQHPPPPDRRRPAASAPHRCPKASPAGAPRERAGAGREPRAAAPQPACAGWAQVVRRAQAAPSHARSRT